MFSRGFSWYACSFKDTPPLGSFQLAGQVNNQFGTKTFVRGNCARAFTLVDILVSVAVMAVLIGVLLPSVAKVRESARRVICQSNLKQIGLGITMFADDNRNLIPESVYGGRNDFRQSPAEMMQLHLGSDNAANWEGLGWLIPDGHITAEGVFYCPSHKGNHAHDHYEDAWTDLGSEIVGNYNYRPLAGAALDIVSMDSQTVLSTDGLRTASDYNHIVGHNSLAADISVTWYSDTNGDLLSLLAVTDQGEFGGDYGAATVWQILDNGGPTPGQLSNPGGTDSSDGAGEKEIQPPDQIGRLGRMGR